MNFLKIIFIFSIVLTLFAGCTKREMRETKYPDGKFKEKFTVAINKDGGFYKDGQYSLWYENGQKKEESIYKKGKMDGKYTSWHKNGQKNIECSFKNGLQDGPYTCWNENGKKTGEGTYKDGKEDGQFSYWGK